MTNKKSQSLQKVIDSESSAFNNIPLIQAIEKDYDFSQKFIIIYGIAAAFYDISKNDNININISPKYIFINQDAHPIVDREKLKSDSETQNLANFVYNNDKYKMFLPVEVIKNGRPSENPEERAKGDAYIYGTICFALFASKLSFDIKEDVNDDFIDVPYCFTNLIKSCCETDPAKRPTFSDILQIIIRQDFIDECNIDLDAFQEYQKTVVDKQFIQDLKLNFTFDFTKIPKVQIRSNDDFTFGKQIGQGGYGVVKIAYDTKNDNKKLAAKEINMSTDEDLSQAKLRIYREVEILASTNNYAVQKLYGIIPGNEKEPTKILTLYEEKGGLDSIIKNHPKAFDFTQKYIVMYGIAAGMHYLHSKNIMHRDVKPENVLMNKNLEPIITDFGLSKQIQDYNNLFQSMAQTGSILYMAPELLDGPQDADYSLYDARLSDVYAFGNVVYNIFTGKRPYYNTTNQANIMMSISKGELPKLPTNFPHALELLLKACGALTPENRPTFEEILRIIGNPTFIEHAGEKVDMKRFEAYQKKVFKDNSIVIKSSEVEIEENPNSLNLPEIPKEQIRTRDDFEVISKPEEDTDPFFITAEVNDIRSGGQYSYFQLKKEYFNDDELQKHFTSMLQVIYGTNHKAVNHPYAFIPGTPQLTFKEDAESLFEIFPRATRGPPIILFPFMKNGNLKTYEDEFSITEKFIILYGIAAGMYNLHKNKYAHLNLNPENILINDQLEPIISLDITSRPHSCKENLFYLLPAFSYPYAAPELLDFKDGRTNTELDEELSDIYSFAMIAYYLFSGLEPWDSCKSYQSILSKTKNNERPMVDNLIPSPFNKLIQDCWYTKPLKRPKFKVILSRLGSSDFIRSIEDLDVEKFKKYQKTVVPNEFIFPIQLYSIRNYDDFEIGKMLGTGMFGIVRLAVDTTNGAQLASKEIPYNEKESKKGLLVDREIKILSEMNFPSIVSLYGIILPEGERKETIILFPYAQYGDLEKMIHKENNNQKLREWNYTQKCIIMYGVAMGMYKLHERDIIHRDLKPQNILINQYLEPWITDFGLSKYVDSNQTMLQSMTVGTPAYMAPETFDEDEEDDGKLHYDGKAADVYSFGVLTFFLMTGMNPWADSKNQFALISKITKGERPPIPPNISGQMKKLIESCWNQNPIQRPKFKEILEIISDPSFFKDPKLNFNDYDFYKYQVKLGELDFIKYSDEQIEKFQKFSSSSHLARDITPSHRLPPSEIIHQMAKEGNPDSQYMYACMLRDGKNVEKNTKEAAIYFKKATDNKNIDAQVAYALLLKEGEGVPKDEAEAHRLMNDAAEKGNTDAQVTLASWYAKERPRKYGLAYELLRKAENNHPDAAAMIGSLMEKRKLGTIPSDEEVMKLYKKSCDMASPEGMYHMATLYHYGIGIEKNTTEAARLYNLAAKNNNDHQGAAVYSLSVLYVETKQYNKAFETADFYRQQDMFEGYLRCYELYQDGIGVTRSIKNAKECLKIAKEPRFAKDQMNMGLLFSRAKGVVRDREKAFQWTEISAQNGSPSGQANLASYYLDAFGCTQDIDKAEEWAKKGVEAGNDHALMILARLYKKKELLDKELECLEKGSQSGNERALVELGKRYKEIKRYDDSIKCLKEASECRIPMGMFLYGKELMSGKYTKQNMKEGIQMIESSAEMGCREAIKKIISIYKDGEKGVKPDPDKVKKFEDIHSKLPKKSHRFTDSGTNLLKSSSDKL